MNSTQRILSSFIKTRSKNERYPPAFLTNNYSHSSLSKLYFSTAPAASATKPEVVKFLFLNNISDNAGAVKKKRRVGRGIGSSKGKTCGRGHKGQRSRSGHGIKPFFEGGQTPFYKRIPKRGFNNKFAEIMTPVNVGKIQDYIDMGRLPFSLQKPLTMKDFVEAGMLKANSIKFGVKLLGDGNERFRSQINIEISRASQSAIAAIEAAGGNITTVHYNKLALRALLKPQKFKLLPRMASPPPKLMPYYTSHDNRGYLSPEIQRKKLLGVEEESEDKQ